MKKIFSVVAAASLVGTAAFAKEPAKQQMVITPPADLKWQQLIPNNPDGPVFAVVHGDLKKGPVSFLVKQPKNFKGPVHSHSTDYHGVVIQGSPIHWVDGDESPKPMTPGTVWHQPAKQMHGDGCVGTTECITLIEQHGPMDAQVKDAPKAAAKPAPKADKAEVKPAPK